MSEGKNEDQMSWPGTCGALFFPAVLLFAGGMAIGEELVGVPIAGLPVVAFLIIVLWVGVKELDARYF